MIFIHRYELCRTGLANAKTKSLVQLGCLLKITDIQNNFGVADICPWPSLGDLTLDQELLQKGPIYQRALQLAQIDLDARKNKTKLIIDVPVKNHALIQDYKTAPQINSEFIKIKADKNIIDLAKYLNGLKDVKIRLDFNFCLTEIEFRSFITLLDPQTLQQIDVIEDPFEFNLIRTCTYIPD